MTNETPNSFKNYLKTYRNKGFTCFSFKMESSQYNLEKQKYVKGKINAPRGWQNKATFDDIPYTTSRTIVLFNFIESLILTIFQKMTLNTLQKELILFTNWRQTLEV